MYYVKFAVLLLVFAVNVDFAHLACRNGWTRFGRSCYHVGRDAAPWYGALIMCRSFGGSLAEINSGRENHFVNKLKQSRRVTHVWLGATDGLIEGVYRRVSNKRVLSYKNWNFGQPDNRHDKQNCLLMWGGGKWDDGYCQSHLHYVCEKRA